jgi:hypothetical protein
MDALTPARRPAGETGPATLFCVARGHQGEWEAFCLDLDLAVQGRSFDEVKDQLERVVAGYVDSALAEPEPARSQLLHRRAPFSVRLTWGCGFWSQPCSRDALPPMPRSGFPCLAASEMHLREFIAIIEAHGFTERIGIKLRATGNIAVSWRDKCGW